LRIIGAEKKTPIETEVNMVLTYQEMKQMKARHKKREKAVRDKLPKKVCKCKLCGHEWISRVVRPRVCPRCKIYNWDKTSLSLDETIAVLKAEQAKAIAKPTTEEGHVQ